MRADAAGIMTDIRHAAKKGWNGDYATGMDAVDRRAGGA
jgi:hypothetical protein